MNNIHRTPVGFEICVRGISMQTHTHTRGGSPSRRNLSVAISRFGCLVGLLGSVMARAADPALLNEEDFVSTMPVVLSASRLSQPQDEAPAAITVIDRQMIDASGARNLPDLFRLVPGMVVGQINGYKQVVSYHGLADAASLRMQVLIDGRSVYLPSFGGVAWSDLPLVMDDIERIEVIRGPNAATYGANSFLGVINIITRHAADAHGGFVRTTVGPDQIRDGVLSTSGGEDAIHYRLTAGYRQDDGFPKVNDSWSSRILNGRWDYNGKRNDLEIQFGYLDGPRGVGEVGSAIDFPRDQQITSRFEQLRWRYRLASGDDVAIQFYHTHHEWDDQYQTLPITVNIPPPVTFTLPVNLDVRSDRYDVEAQHTFSAGKQWRFVWGGGLRRDDNLAPGWLGTTDTVSRRLYRLFGNVEWRIVDPLVFNVGAMYEHYDLTGSNVSPRAALNLHVAPGHTLRIGASSATRQPVTFEEQSNERYCVPLVPGCTVFDQIFLSTATLQPERIDSVELGYLGRLGPALSADLRLYRDQVFDLISNYTHPYPDLNNKVLDYHNSGKATLIGSELQLQYQPARDTRLIAGLANTQIESNNADGDSYSTSAPRFSASLLAIQQLGSNWTASTAFYYQDHMRFVDYDAVPLDVLRRLDLRLAWRFRMVDGRGELALVLQNVLGEQVVYKANSLASPTGYLTASFGFR